MAFLCLSMVSIAQKGTVSGVVTADGETLIGATVIVRGQAIGTATDLDGSYSLSLAPGTYTLDASYIGFSTQSVEVTIGESGNTDANFTLSEGVNFDEVIVTGTRANARVNTDAPVPIDVINMDKLSAAAPQTNLNQILHYTAPSFSSNTQTISDGTDHIDPAALRGLGPDQVLVLINGKRRHTSSLVNVNGTFGRGNVGTDLNAIPAAAIKKLEVLRDGAAAQYGSDAIAGVINLRLRDEVNKLNVSLNTGANFTSKIGSFGGETPAQDGETIDLGLNYGLPLGKNGGYINMTGQMGVRGRTNRMVEFTGGIFNAYNAIERMGRDAGMDISAWNPNNTDDVLAVTNLASQVGHFSQDLKDQIAGAATVADLQSALGTDVTDGELGARGLERSDFNMLVGQSRLREGKAFVNMALPVGENMEVYGFGGMGYRDGQSGCFYRLPNQNRTTTSIYPNGTVPRINSQIFDGSGALGIRGMIGDWNIDFSNVYGQNSFLFHMTETHNATLGASSPTTFDAGGHSFAQNTGNFDVSQYFDVDGINGLNVAFGSEYRFERFQVIPGTVQSFGNYDVNGNLVTPTTDDGLLSRDFLGRNHPSGAQCFAGFLPTNEVDARRSSVAGYVDLEADVTDAFLIGAAVRFENYSDFGSTFNYKVAGRYKLTSNLNLRAGYSTGFRAPSLHQIHFSRTSTIFELINGVSVPTERGTFANDSRAAKLLGIPQLEEETSSNISAGITLKVPESGIRFTLDAYQVDIDDRVVLTGAFGPGDDAELQSIFDQAQAGSATFFANAISTRSQGIDVVLGYNVSLGSGKSLDNTLAGTFAQTVWLQDEGINSSDLLREKGLEGTYFDQTARIYLEQGVPLTKITLGNTLNWGKLDVYLRNTYFGRTTEATNDPLFDEDLNLLESASIDPYNDPKIITDLSLGYSISDDLRLTVGANNLLDIYPDEADPAFQSSGRFVYSRRAPQFSYAGRHLFARVNFTLD